jgi:predicted hydrocarbon binding protein
VRSLQKFIEAELTPEQRDAVFAQLPAEYAERFRGTILPTETIPVHMLNVWTEVAAKTKGESLQSFGQRAGSEAASDAVNGLLRFLARVLTPTALLSRGGQMWRALYNRGELRVEEETPGGAHISLPDFPSEAAGCARMTGWIERMAQLTNVKDIRIEHNQCFTKGARCCEWRISWK